MFSKLIVTIFLLALLMPAGLAQEDKPTVAILRYGPFGSAPAVELGMLDMLQVYEWINAEERALLNQRQDLAGENLNIIWGAANFDLPTVNIMVEDALDRGADVLITASAPVTQIAVNITQDQDEPTPVLFHSVYNAIQFGITDAPCIKPAHVAGSEYIPPYDEAFQVFLQLNPTLERVGSIHSSTVASGIYGAQRINEIAADLGIAVESAAIANVSELRAAAQSLVAKGVEAFVLPIDYTVGSGLPIIVSVANDNLIPVFYPIPGTVLDGVTVGAGYNEYYGQGVSTGLILDAYLNGDLDIARAAIDSQTGVSVGVNLEIAAELGIAIPQELQDTAAVFVREDGTLGMGQEALRQQLDAQGANDMIKQMVLAMADTTDFRGLIQPDGEQAASPEMTMLTNMLIAGRRAPDYMAADQEYLQSLQCTDEMIAEQQAALEAAEG